ncbi:hypothetical protein B0H12DRAFT_1135969 [Mycena haematopus]|nr:hypothetical protein B0H12DRAFT_1135969 [Mycena haematopus]
MPISFPTEHLTRYDINGPWAMHRAILTRAPNLAEAHICVELQDESWLDASEIIDLPALDRLAITRLEVLRYIRTPVLQELALSMNRSSIVWELQPFLSRSSCTLRCLCSYPDAIIAVLTSIPSIVELRIMLTAAGFTGWKKLINKLTVNGVRLPVAPRLSSISVGSNLSNVFDCDTYVEMVKSRWKSPNCDLSRAMFLTNFALDLDTLEDKREMLRQEGLDFRSVSQGDMRALQASWLHCPIQTFWP